MIKSTIYFLTDIYKNKELLFELSKREFRQEYQGTYLGFFWMLIQPLLFIGILYFVFTYGLRAGDTDDMPFVLYLITGIIGWIYFSENITSCTYIISSYNFLVKKVDFRLSMLPIVKIISTVIPHIFLLAFTIMLAWYKGYSPSLYSLQVVYYYCALIFILIGIGWITSSTSLFIKDVSKFVGLLIQFGFWLTPIIWNISRVPDKYQWIIKLNPMVYVIEGYRDSIIRHKGFWENPYDFIIFWSTTFIILLVGISVFRKLRPHFAEVI